MSTLENTISMMKTLPEADLLQIQMLTQKLFRKHIERPFPPKSRNEIYEDLEFSRKQAAKGECMEMGQAIKEIRQKYGI